MKERLRMGAQPFLLWMFSDRYFFLDAALLLANC